MSSAAKPYHHGALEQALVEEAVRQVRERGTDQVSLRGLAQTMGVSPSAAYQHFPDKAALLHGRLSPPERTSSARLMQAAVDAVDDPGEAGAIERFLGVGRAYVDFARPSRTSSGTCSARSAPRRRGTRPEPGGREPDRRALRSSCCRASRSSPSAVCSGPVSTRLALDVLAWSLVHGFSSLLVDGFLPFEAGSRCCCPLRPARHDRRRPSAVRGGFADRHPRRCVGRGPHGWTLTSSSSAPASPGSSPPPSSPTPGAGSSWSSRRARRTSAARRSGRSAGCSSSTPPSSGGWASATRADLAWQDWLGTAGFDRLDPGATAPPQDHWPRRWARAYVDFAAGEKRAWLRELGIRLFPVVGLGRAGRRPRRRPGQLGAAVPHRLGHRTRHRRAVRAPGPGARRRGPGAAGVPASRRRPRRRAAAPWTASRGWCWRRTPPSAGGRRTAR